MKTFRGEAHFEKFIDGFWKMLSNLVLLCFSSMLLIMVLQVLFRYVLKISVPWTDEAARSLFIWAIFLGCALAQRGRNHIRITIFIDRLEMRTRKWVELGIDIFNSLILIVILIGSVKMMWKTYGILLSAIPVSFTYVYLSLTIGAGIMLLLSLKQIRQSLARNF